MNKHLKTLEGWRNYVIDARNKGDGGLRDYDYEKVIESINLLMIHITERDVPKVILTSAWLNSEIQVNMNFETQKRFMLLSNKVADSQIGRVGMLAIATGLVRTSNINAALKEVEKAYASYKAEQILLKGDAE
jgi:hypothetical protein